MIPELILLQFIAHLFADFIFQPQSWSTSKSHKSITLHHFYHGMVVFVFAYLLSFDFRFWWSAIVIAIVHFLTDILKSHLEFQTQEKSKAWNYFFFDQFIHILSFVLISLLYNKYTQIRFIFDLPFKGILITAAFVFCAKPANIIIKNIFSLFSIEIPENRELDTPQEESGIHETSLPNAGKLIGIMERFLALALILVGQFSAVGLIIAAKSILRFRSTVKNEYILVGTLLSFGIAVLIGILVLQISLSAN